MRKTFKIFGPGLVTGADDDPSGIATYSSVGAQFGPSMLWTMPLVYPFMAAIQEGGLIYAAPSRELNFWRPAPEALLALGFRSYTDISTLKKLQE